MVVRRSQRFSSGCRPIARRLALEKLDSRELLATLNVGPGLAFATVQAAVNNAAVGDIVQVAGTTFNESVNISLMGSALAGGGQRGNLTIRGADTFSSITAPAGSALFNSQPFSGDLRLEKLILGTATATAGDDNGIDLDSYTGSLVISEVTISNPIDRGVEITNSSGPLLIDRLDVSRVDEGTTTTGIRLANYSATGYIKQTNVSDVTDASIIIEAGGTTQMQVMLLDNTLGGTSGSEVVGNDGIRALASGSAKLDLGIARNNFDELPGNSIDLTVLNTAQAHAQVHDNIVVNTEGLVRVANEPAVRFLTQNTASLTLGLEGNTLGGIGGDSILVQAVGASKINATIIDNLLTNVGTAIGHDGIVITSDAASTATINALVYLNQIVSPFGHGISIAGVGAAIFNVRVKDNFVIYSGPNEPTDPATFDSNASGFNFETAGAATGRLNLSITGNDVQLPSDPGLTTPRSIRLNRIAPANATIHVEYPNTSPTVTQYLIDNNFVTKTPSVSGVITRANVDAFLGSMPLVIGDRVWNDTDKNGLRKTNSPEETGSDGTMLKLTGTETVGGAAVNLTAFTDNDGQFFFGGLLPGTYTVTLTPPTGFEVTSLDRTLPGNQAGSEAVDSDFRHAIRNGAMVREATVTLVAGADHRDLDAGLIPTNGRLWHNQISREDVDGNGVVTPLDALLVIIDLNAKSPRELNVTTAGAPQPFIDVDGNGSVTSLDALLVIIRLNSETGSGEGEAKSASASAAAADPTPEYLPPDFFAPARSDTTGDEDEDEASALDAFFAGYGA